MSAVRSADENVKLGPSRKEYTVTNQGEIEFKNLLKSALVSVDIQQFSAGIAFMNMLPRHTVILLLQQRRAELARSLEFLKSLPTEDFNPVPSKHPELIGIWVGYVENEAATTERILESIRAGKYTFKSGGVVRE